MELKMKPRLVKVEAHASDGVVIEYNNVVIGSELTRLIDKLEKDGFLTVIEYEQDIADV